MKQKSILAFSGGLDTSVVVKYMQDMHDMDVITVTVDVGQGDDSNKIAKKAKKLFPSYTLFLSSIRDASVAGKIVLKRDKKDAAPNDGIDYSSDSGMTWKHFSDEGYYTVRFLNDTTAYAAGNGKISKLYFK